MPIDSFSIKSAMYNNFNIVCDHNEKSISAQGRVENTKYKLHPQDTYKQFIEHLVGQGNLIALYQDGWALVRNTYRPKVICSVA